MTTSMAITWVEGLGTMLREPGSAIERIRSGEGLASLTAAGLGGSLLGSMLFGIALGSFAGTPEQVAASSLKVPLLLLGAAAICFPAFYVFQLLTAPKALSLRQALALHAVTLATVGLVWGSLAPPLLFLIGTSFDYHLAQLLAVAIGALGGLVGLARLGNGFCKLCDAETSAKGYGFLLFYLTLFGCVGAQLAWLLRPFVGSPSLPFQIFRQLEGSFFSYLLAMVKALLS